jgi:hypothetical protein
MHRFTDTPASSSQPADDMTFLERLAAAEELDVFTLHDQEMAGHSASGMAAENPMQEAAFQVESLVHDIDVAVTGQGTNITSTLGEMVAWQGVSEQGEIQDMSLLDIFDGEEGEELRQLLGPRGMRMLEEWQSGKYAQSS